MLGYPTDDPYCIANPCNTHLDQNLFSTQTHPKGLNFFPLSRDDRIRACLTNPKPGQNGLEKAEILLTSDL